MSGLCKLEHWWCILKTLCGLPASPTRHPSPIPDLYHLEMREPSHPALMAYLHLHTYHEGLKADACFRLCARFLALPTLCPSRSIALRDKGTFTFSLDFLPIPSHLPQALTCLYKLEFSRLPPLILTAVLCHPRTPAVPTHPWTPVHRVMDTTFIISWQPAVCVSSELGALVSSGQLGTDWCFHHRHVLLILPPAGRWAPPSL